MSADLRRGSSPLGHTVALYGESVDRQVVWELREINGYRAIGTAMAARGRPASFSCRSRHGGIAMADSGWFNQH